MNEAEIVDRYASPKLLAQVSSSPIAVCELIFAAANSDPAAVKAIRSGGASQGACRSRQAIVWVARTKLGASFYEIGRAINRDHSTALYSFRIADALVKRDEGFREMCERIAG